MKCIVVTPAGRRRYMELLYRHLAAQRADFDHWQIWLNTRDAADVQYFLGLQQKHPDWIRCVPCPVPVDGTGTICHFFRACTDPDAVYIRLDDDVVWLEPGFVRRMFEFRRANPQYFLVYGNIVNNVVLSHLQQRFGNLGTQAGVVEFNYVDEVGWKSPDFVRLVHESFLDAATTQGGERLRDWRFKQWELTNYEHVSINCIAWLGAEMAAFGGRVDVDEETFLAVHKPRELQKKNCIFGGALCVHYAFCMQRDYMDRFTDFLERYRALAPPEPPQ